MSGSYNLTLFELLQLSKVKEKMIQTYRIKSAKWNNELVKPLGNFYVHGITLPTNSWTQEPGAKTVSKTYETMNSQTH